MFLLSSDYWWISHETSSPVLQTVNSQYRVLLTEGGVNHTPGTGQYMLASRRHWL